MESGPADRRPWHGGGSGKARPMSVCAAPTPGNGLWSMYGPATRRRARASGNATERKSTVELARPPLSRPIGHHRNLIRCQKSIPKKEKYLARVALKQAPASRATDKRVSCPLACPASRRVASCGSFEYSYTQLASLWPGNHGGREGEREGESVAALALAGSGVEAKSMRRERAAVTC